MKTCPKCNELNGDARDTCFGCGEPIKAKAAHAPYVPYRKKCRKCGKIFDADMESCPTCFIPLSVYNTKIQTSKTGQGPGCLLMIVSFILPFIGIVLGCIYIARQEDDNGKTLIAIGLVSLLIAFLIGVLFL